MSVCQLESFGAGASAGAYCSRGSALEATDKCTRQINVTHAHLASLIQAADGCTAGQPRPALVWSIITEKLS